ncbi:hypothetical protein EDB81DRAFT_759813 [Dactylonectria macrodidyma]|uniref:Uncharacterized protein n=1 Tax=Dactylonectria macrodidyma TaxID=307937 RepID=A0A9P9J6P9_9HYPO|nr:hypothetical protein EDB81DRAFT_759813 [Dactylonectria macrodidyma]
MEPQDVMADGFVELIDDSAPHTLGMLAHEVWWNNPDAQYNSWFKAVRHLWDQQCPHRLPRQWSIYRPQTTGLNTYTHLDIKGASKVSPTESGEQGMEGNSKPTMQCGYSPQLGQTKDGDVLRNVSENIHLGACYSPTLCPLTAPFLELREFLCLEAINPISGKSRNPDQRSPSVGNAQMLVDAGILDTPPETGVGGIRRRVSVSTPISIFISISISISMTPMFSVHDNNGAGSMPCQGLRLATGQTCPPAPPFADGRSLISRHSRMRVDAYATERTASSNDPRLTVNEQDPSLFVQFVVCPIHSSIPRLLPRPHADGDDSAFGAN